jgi:hypothetical protein
VKKVQTKTKVKLTSLLKELMGSTKWGKIMGEASEKLLDSPCDVVLNGTSEVGMPQLAEAFGKRIGEEGFARQDLTPRFLDMSENNVSEKAQNTQKAFTAKERAEGLCLALRESPYNLPRLPSEASDGPAPSSAVLGCVTWNMRAAYNCQYMSLQDFKVGWCRLTVPKVQRVTQVQLRFQRLTLEYRQPL